MGHCNYPRCENVKQGCFRPNCKFAHSYGMSKPEEAPVITLDALEAYIASMPETEIWRSDIDAMLDHFKQAAGREI